MLSAGGTGGIPKEWDDGAGAYKLRGITADTYDNGQLNVAVAANDNEILIRGNSVDGSLTYTPYGGSPTTIAEWLDGLMTTVGGDIPMVEPGVFPGGGTGGIRWADCDDNDLAFLEWTNGLITNSYAEPFPDITIVCAELCITLREFAKAKLRPISTGVWKRTFWRRLSHGCVCWT